MFKPNHEKTFYFPFPSFRLRVLQNIFKNPVQNLSLLYQICDNQSITLR